MYNLSQLYTMDFLQWLDKVVFDVPAIKAVAVISLCCAIGLSLGKFKIKGIGLGVTWVFFMGILLGGLGVTIDHEMLIYAEDFGLIIFVYVLGLQVGPGFMSSFRSGGTVLSLLSLTLIFVGTIATLVPRMEPLGRNDGSALWRHNQHAGSGGCTASSEPDAPSWRRTGRCSLLGCDLPHRYGGRYHCSDARQRLSA